MKPILFTDKQLEIMSLVFQGDGAGGFIDIDTLRDKLSYRVSKQAIQCSLKFLEGAGYVTRDYQVRRGARRRLVSPTVMAFQVLRGEVAGLGSAEPEMSRKP